MILHFTLSTSEIKEIKLVVRGIHSFDYDALYNKLSINVEEFFIIDCMPDNLSWQDFNSSCNPDILIFYDVVEFHCDDTWCSIPDPEPFDWEAFEDPDDPHPDDPDYEDDDFPF